MPVTPHVGAEFEGADAAGEPFASPDTAPPVARALALEPIDDLPNQNGNGGGGTRAAKRAIESASALLATGTATSFLYRIPQ